ncbi:unnamed protein product [Protopolystoma xenopodis]|uniref:Uncharacterized protein n=1 Tax=Protopolystoma xenopodis TaxID=117903 RepID=A0A3S5B4S0_9PLAT|nr:unnamed protein product [Protopolystoma xenopodis]
MDSQEDYEECPTRSDMMSISSNPLVNFDSNNFDTLFSYIPSEVFSSSSSKRCGTTNAQLIFPSFTALVDVIEPVLVDKAVTPIQSSSTALKGHSLQRQDVECMPYRHIPSLKSDIPVTNSALSSQVCAARILLCAPWPWILLVSQLVQQRLLLQTHHLPVLNCSELLDDVRFS